MESELVRITKLRNTENWGPWKFQIRVLLNASDVLKVVDGTSPRPVLPQPAAVGDISPANYQALVASWEKGDGIAQKIIATSVGEQPLLHIMNCTSSKQMWDKLHAVYEQRSETSVHLLQQKWYSLTKDPAIDMASHISKIEDLGHRLSILGEPISESMMATKILMTLPSSYSHFTSAWESTSEDRRTLANLTARLIMEESRIGTHEEEENSALMMRRFHKKGKAKKGLCHACKSPGHWRRDCPQRNGHGNAKSKDPSPKDSRRGDAFIGEVTALATDVNVDKDTWFLDSGASHHMSHRRSWFINYEKFQDTMPVRLGDGKFIHACGEGDINILAYDNHKWVEKHLAKVLYVPEMKYNLFSAGAVLDKGLEHTSDQKACRFTKDGKIVAVGVRKNKLYEMKFEVVEPTEENHAEGTARMNLAAEDTLQLWHERLVHQNVAHVKKVLKTMDIKVRDTGDFFCEACALGKSHRLPFPKSSTKSREPGEIIHADVCGPMPDKSIKGSRYFLLFKDDYTHYRVVYFLQNKSEVQQYLQQFLAVAEKDIGRSIKVLRTDNGLEFINKDVQEITQRHGIRHQRTVSYTPEQNGSAERENRTIVEAARTMIHAKNLGSKLWAEAVNAAVYVLNRSGTSTEKDVTPYELWFGKKPHLENLKVFGTEAFVHVPKERRRKWDRKARKAYFVGYDENVKGFRLWFPDEDRVEVSRDVLFKNELPVHGASDDTGTVDVGLRPIEEKTTREGNGTEAEDVQQATEEEDNILEGRAEGYNDVADDDIFEDAHAGAQEEYAFEEDEEESQDSQYRLRDRRSLKRPSRYDIFVAEQSDPLTYEDAINDAASEQWKHAMIDEMDSLLKNRTWVLVDLPKDQKVIGNRWVFQVKRKPDGDIERYKARLVVKGFTQRYGIDYSETFSPVVKFDSIRFILAIAASRGLKLQQFDVKTAFLNGDLDETVYMQQPKGYEDGTGRICKLQKSLYGLKQASRCWNRKFTDLLRRFNLKATNSDPCVFVAGSEGHMLILAIYIDDGLIAATSKEMISRLMRNLQGEFDVKTSELNLFLGLQIELLGDGAIFIHQEGYVKRIIERFEMENANAVAVPADPHHEMSASAHGHSDGKRAAAPYREAVGSLMYLTVATRPDIAFAVSSVSQYLEDPFKIHWNAVKRIFKYLKGTASHGLLFKRGEDLRLRAYSDADYAGDLDTRRSTTGYVFKLGESTVAWSSQRQKVVALSTTESEYIAATQTVKELIWLRNLEKELLGVRREKPLLHMDNQSAMKLVKNPEYHKRTKHIDVRYHFIREKYEEGIFEMRYVPSKEQQADLLTKPLAREAFQSMRDMLNVKERGPAF